MITVTAECRQGHTQALQLDADLGMDYAVMLGGLMDGTSRFYIYPPGPSSTIGKCSICQSPITVTVAEEDDPPDARVKPPVVDPSSDEFKHQAFKRL
jgi:hypothetical protein